MIELADEMDGTIEGEEVPMAMVADIHPAAAVGAVTVEDVELPEGEVGLLRPEMRQGVDLRAARTSSASILKRCRRIQEELRRF
jgi:hypothetical protein